MLKVLLPPGHKLRDANNQWGPPPQPTDFQGMTGMSETFLAFIAVGIVMYMLWFGACYFFA